MSDHLDKRNAFIRAAKWCAYQERAHSEVRNKLFEWNAWPREVDEVISMLIADNYLNEERFAKAYVSGKFKIKKWGRYKIKQGLKLKQVPDKMIAKALATIDGDEYMDTIWKIAEKKAALMKESDGLKKRFKLVTYLQSRGFEQDLIFDVLNANNLC